MSLIFANPVIFIQFTLFFSKLNVSASLSSIFDSKITKSSLLYLINTDLDLTFLFSPVYIKVPGGSPIFFFFFILNIFFGMYITFFYHMISFLDNVVTFKSLTILIRV